MSVGFAPAETLEDQIERLGNVPLSRIRWRPHPGTATVQDVIDIEARERRLFELVDGILVEKASGWRESSLAMILGMYLNQFVLPRNLGVVTGPDGPYRLTPRLVRMPDVAFISWGRMPNRTPPESAVPEIVPNIAAEVLSKGNTEGEMERKRGEYFAAGVELVWIADPESRSVRVYVDAETCTTLTEADTLDGGKVLPGFTLPLRDWFAELDRHG